MAEPRTVREDANTLNSEQIAAILPHRYPFALVDRILDYEPGQWAIGRKCVTRNEEFFCGHFPGQPVMPGVLILEALAQTGAVAAHPPLRTGGAARPGGRGKSFGLCGRQVRRHRRADLCPDRQKQLKYNKKADAPPENDASAFAFLSRNLTRGCAACRIFC